MPLQHGGLVIEVPDGWADRSSLLFVAPREPSTLPSAVKVEEPTESLSVRFESVDPETTAMSLLEDEHARFVATVGIEPEVVEDAAFVCPLGAGRQRIQKIALGGAPLRQICVAVVVGKVAVLATATAGEARFARVKPQLERALAGLRCAR